MKKLAWLLLFPLGLSAQEIQVRLFSDQNISSFAARPRQGQYAVVAYNTAGQPLDTVGDLLPGTAGNEVQVKPASTRVQAWIGQRDFGTYSSLRVVPMSGNAEAVISAGGRQRLYGGTFRCAVHESRLMVVNHEDLEEYVAGVVESEGGHEPEFEYFKAQAVLARTFALKNWNKHRKDGYNLKDDVTSQVYKSKAYLRNSGMIRKAVEETRGEVLVDETCSPILGAFFANSGGQTANSEEAWIQAVPYLRSKADPFSLGQASETWEKRIPKDRFIGYFARQLGQDANDIHFRKAVLNLRQPQRISRFVYKGKSLPLKHVRTEFGLRSTFFEVVDEGDQVLLRGRGYGHGVGLSQDGAINMSRLGFCYDEILYFYYQSVELESLQHLTSW